MKATKHETTTETERTTLEFEHQRRIRFIPVVQQDDSVKCKTTGLVHYYRYR